jgi:hypothetical protein
MKDLFDSVVRTMTPIIVGAVLGWVTTLGIDPDPGFAPALTLVVGGAFAVLWHIGVRLLETYVSPRFGWLIGLAKQPVYERAAK